MYQLNNNAVGSKSVNFDSEFHNRDSEIKDENNHVFKDILLMSGKQETI